MPTKNNTQQPKKKDYDNKIFKGTKNLNTSVFIV